MLKSLLEPLVVDPDVLNPLVRPGEFKHNPQGRFPQLVERVNAIYWKLQQLGKKADPSEADLVTEDDIGELLHTEGSQIGRKEAHFGHIVRTAKLYRKLVEAVQDRYDGRLALPDPHVAQVHGLVHDLAATYMRYDDTFIQDEKDWALYLHSRLHGINFLADEVALHNAYLSFLEMVREGEGFERVHLYEAWTQALNDPEGDFYFGNLQREFSGFLEGTDRLGLILLNVADCIENGKSSLDLSQLGENYLARMDDIMERHYHAKKEQGKPPTAFGISLVDRKELKRLDRYRDLAIDLLAGTIPYNDLPESFKK